MDLVIFSHSAKPRQGASRHRTTMQGAVSPWFKAHVILDRGSVAGTPAQGGFALVDGFPVIDATCRSFLRTSRSVSYAQYGGLWAVGDSTDRFRKEEYERRRARCFRAFSNHGGSSTMRPTAKPVPSPTLRWHGNAKKPDNGSTKGLLARGGLTDLCALRCVANLTHSVQRPSSPRSQTDDDGGQACVWPKLMVTTATRPKASCRQRHRRDPRTENRPFSAGDRPLPKSAAAPAGRVASPGCT
jgi:hypothetical protein